MTPSAPAYKLLKLHVGLASLYLLSFGAQACAQIIINTPPTVIHFGGVYYLDAGTTLNVYDGAEIHSGIGVKNGAVLNLFGGELEEPVGAGDGAVVNIYSGNIAGGILGDFIMGVGSHTTMKGGWFTRPILKQSTATLVIEGVDFAFSGVPVPGLAFPGDEVSVSIPENGLFTGIFANGSPFTFFSSPSSGDDFYGNVTLRQVARPTGPTTASVPAEAMPTGVLPGQTLIVNDGASLPNGMNGAPGSTLDVRGGQVRTFEAYHSNVLISAGLGGRVIAYTGSSVTLTGGQTSRVEANEGSTVKLQGGQLGFLAVYPDAYVAMSEGDVNSLTLLRGASAAMSGGNIKNSIEFSQDSEFELSGGVIPKPLNLGADRHFVMRGGRDWD